jgi:hypothetical protein
VRGHSPTDRYDVCVSPKIMPARLPLPAARNSEILRDDFDKIEASASSAPLSPRAVPETSAAFINPSMLLKIVLRGLDPRIRVFVSGAQSRGRRGQAV